MFSIARMRVDVHARGRATAILTKRKVAQRETETAESREADATYQPSVDESDADEHVYAMSLLHAPNFESKSYPYSLRFDLI